MTHVCIKCHRTWVTDQPSDEPSGGLCDQCFTEYIRSRQRKVGYHDCFRRCTEVCNRRDCAYWKSCNKKLLATFDQAA